MNFIADIQRLIDSCQDQVDVNDECGYLPEVIKVLGKLKESIVERNGQNASNCIKGIGRLVTDDFQLSESDLGNSIFDLLSELRKSYPSDCTK